MADAAIHVDLGAGHATCISGREHRFVADMVHDDGSASAGPAPWELVLAGMGACTAMTVRIYADRKQWPVSDVLVDVERTGERIHLHVQIEGEVDDEQLARLGKVAARCPVVTALSAGLQVTEEVTRAV